MLNDRQPSIPQVWWNSDRDENKTRIVAIERRRISVWVLRVNIVVNNVFFSIYYDFDSKMNNPEYICNAVTMDHDSCVCVSYIPRKFLHSDFFSYIFICVFMQATSYLKSLPFSCYSRRIDYTICAHQIQLHIFAMMWGVAHFVLVTCEPMITCGMSRRIDWICNFLI